MTKQKQCDCRITKLELIALKIFTSKDLSNYFKTGDAIQDSFNEALLFIEHSKKQIGNKL